MEIIENHYFTRRIREFLSDDEYNVLQQTLIVNPEAGAVIPGGGGLRKLRWAVQGRGKSGGLRIIYYWYTKSDRIYLLYVYKKTDQEDLTREQIALFKDYIKGGLL